MYKARYSILLDTNVLVRLIEDLDCGRNLCKDLINLIKRRLLCNCNLNASIIVPKGLLKEVNHLIKGKEKSECRKVIKFCLLKYASLAAVGGRRKHKIFLQSYENSRSELEDHPVFMHIQENYEITLGKVGDQVDRTLINIAILQASKYKKAGDGKVVLLSMDRVLCEKVHVLASRAQLTDYLVVPCLWMVEQTSPCIDANYFMECIRRCLNSDCFVRCLLGGLT
jgi:nitrogen regulatory protein PII